MRKVFVCLGALATVLCFAGAEVRAAEDVLTFEKEAENPSEDTVVFGAANTPSGGKNEALIEQSPDGGNPLGDPIVSPDNDAGLPVAPDTQENAETVKEPSEPQIKPVVQSSKQGELKPWEEPLPQLSDKIENELYQSGNDIIDVQAYPIKDVSTVTEPNIQPVVVTQ